MPEWELLALGLAAQPFRNLVSKALSVGEAAAAVHIQEVSRVVFEVGQWQGVLLAEVALGLGFQERTLVVGEGHGEKGIGVTDKLVDVSLPGHLLHDALLIVIAQRSAELVVVHGWPVLLDAPTPSNLLRFDQLELHASACPGNEVGIGWVIEKGDQELPQLKGTSPLIRGPLPIHGGLLFDFAFQSFRNDTSVIKVQSGVFLI